MHLRRKIDEAIETHLREEPNSILCVDGARQIGKSTSIRTVGKKLFRNFVEINFIEDKEGDAIFENVRTVRDFYFQLGLIAGSSLGSKKNTLVFLDEIQVYPHLLTLLKFLLQDNRYTYIVSGSQLGLALKKTASIPIGSIRQKRMYPLDFEEFLWANGAGEESIALLRESYEALEPLSESTHRYLLDAFKKYLLVGGLPEAVTAYLTSNDLTKVRRIHDDIHDLYGRDASKYDEENKLKIMRVYNYIPSVMENKKNRVVYKNIENKDQARYENYLDEFDYLIGAGIAIDVKAVPYPNFPLSEAMTKNLLKLYLNDVGLLTNILFKDNARAILDDKKGINLGNCYESVVAEELKAHHDELFYYDNKHNGEVDFLLNDYSSLSCLPIEVKSGKDYKVHRAMDKLLSTKEYGIDKGIVLSNDGTIKKKNGVTYLPIYMAMFI